MKKKLVKDFMQMTKLDVFLYDGIYKNKDEYLEKELQRYEKEMCKYCFEKPNPKKFFEAHTNYQEILRQKIDNKEEWINCQKAAKQRKINLNEITIDFKDLP